MTDWGLPGQAPPLQRQGQGGDFGLLCTSRHSLGKLTISDLPIKVLDVQEVHHNLHRTSGVLTGGQAAVHFCKWTSLPGSTIIPDGLLVAIKHVLAPLGGGRFTEIKTESDFQHARAMGLRGLRAELNVLAALHLTSCGRRVVKPLGVVRWPGKWIADAEERGKTDFEPLFGYVMRAYPRSSVSTLLADICHRNLPESAAQCYVGPVTLASEFRTLLGELRCIHTTEGAQLMLQDLTPGNLLVDDTPEAKNDSSCPPSSVRLLFSDPAMALPIRVLQQPDPPLGSVVGTWLWGSMRVRSGLFDPKADLYSLSFIFAEMWLVAEGAAQPAVEIIRALGVDSHEFRGVNFLRVLVFEVLRTHFYGGNMVPRIKRHLPVSWLGAWVLLLGFRDYLDEGQMQRLPCLRPQEEEMLEVAELWASIATAAEGLPQDLTLEQARSDACQPLVGDMCGLLRRLMALSHLEDEQQPDHCLRWMAANFMEQKHPLVLAMAEQGMTGHGQAGRILYCAGWAEVVDIAQRQCGHAADAQRYRDLTRTLYQQLRNAQDTQQHLASVHLWYRGLQHELPPHQRLPPELEKAIAEAVPQQTPQQPETAPAGADATAASASRADSMARERPAAGAATATAGTGSAPAAASMVRLDLAAAFPSMQAAGLLDTGVGGAQRRTVLDLAQPSFSEAIKQAEQLAQEQGVAARQPGSPLSAPALCLRASDRAGVGNAVGCAVPRTAAAAAAALAAAESQGQAAFSPAQPSAAPQEAAAATAAAAAATDSRGKAALSPAQKSAAPLGAATAAAAASEIRGDAAAGAAGRDAPGGAVNPRPQKRRRQGYPSDAASGVEPALSPGPVATTLAAAELGAALPLAHASRRTPARSGRSGAGNSAGNGSGSCSGGCDAGQLLKSKWPDLVQATLRAALPGEEQLPDFKEAVMTPDDVIGLLELWASTAKTWEEVAAAPGVLYSQQRKGRWNEAVFKNAGSCQAGTKGLRTAACGT